MIPDDGLLAIGRHGDPPMSIGREMAIELLALRAALRSIAKNTCCDRCQEAALIAKQALAP